MKTSALKRRRAAVGSILAVYLFVLCLSVCAQAPSSRQIPFSGVVTTISPSTPGQALTLRVLDNSNPPVALYCETQTLDVDSNGAITFNLGSGTAANPPCSSAPPGLNPADFASGSTRSLDVVDANGNSVLPNPPGPIPLRAVAFALSPGPAGPAGPQGDKGDQGSPGQQGPPGVVQAVTPGDASITVAGTVATPSVAVSPNGITNSHIANAALSPAKINGTAAVLSGDTFSGPLEVAPNSASYALRIDQGVNGHGLLSYVNTTASNKIVFAAASNAGAGFNVMGDGKVGIGTATPGAMLDVNGTAHFSGAVTGGSISVNSFTGQFMSLSGNGIIGGNLGVGTTTPSHKAELVDASNTGLRVQTNSGGGTVASFGGFGAFQIDAPGVVGGRLTVSENGNVGVGTSSPAAKLDVAGSVRIGGDTPMSSNPHMSFSGSIPGTLCVNGDPACGGGACNPCIAGAFQPDRDVQITRITVSLNSAIDPSCSSRPLYIIDASSGQVLFQWTLPAGSSAWYGDTGPVAVNVAAGQRVALSASVFGCHVGASAGGTLFVNAQYVMR